MNVSPHSTRRLGLALLAASLLACASEPPSRERTVLLGNENRAFLILPLNVAAPMPPGLEPFRHLLWKEMELYLRAHGKQLKTISPQAARELWLRNVRAVRASGQGARVGYDDAARALARDLRGRAEFDTLIAPSLLVREARIADRFVRWDGVEHELQIEARSFAAKSFAATPIEGVAPAASIHVAVFDSDGNKLHEAQGGLELLIRVRVAQDEATGEHRYEFAERLDPFTDSDALRDGIAAAFSPFLPRLPD